MGIQRVTACSLVQNLKKKNHNMVMERNSLNITAYPMHFFITAWDYSDIIWKFLDNVNRALY